MSAPEERLLRLLQDARHQLETERARRMSPIAIVGMGCRFPGGASSPERYWQILHDGVDATTDVPADRWNVDAFYDPDPAMSGKSYVKRGGYLGDIAGFEPEIFGISAREAEGMDPQQRLLLEVTWEALENAGIAPDRLDGSATGVWMGICFDDYARRSLWSSEPERIDVYNGLGNSRAIAVGRISYVFGLRGPAMHLDTACSSSLVALHLACQSLRAGECDLALAGGVNLITSPELNIVFCQLRSLSPNGRCKTFDAGADGYGRGEGCGVVVLKRLADAEAAGDRIHAVVRGTAVNHDGRSNGLTAPNGTAQEAVIRAALATAVVAPNQIDYVEAHGTGTPLGDPIEVLALGRVYGSDRPPDRPLLIGSVKTNFGHLEGAAGVAGLIKLALCVSRGALPPHLNFQMANPRIPWGTLPIRVATDAQAWDRHDRPRRGGLSAFGMSGTNAHVIVEEAPAARSATAPLRDVHLLTLSARTPPALGALASEYDRALASASSADLPGICATANTGRASLSVRAAVVGATVDELRAGMQAISSGTKNAHVVTDTVTRGQQPRVAFLYSGQGAQHSGMGRELYETDATYRAALDRCAAIVDGPLLEIILGSSGDPERVHQTLWTQPALFAVEYALTELWRSWGVVPSAVIGHSAGELVAATVAGVFSLEDGLRLVAARGRAMQEHMPPGAMAAVQAPAEAVRAILVDHREVVVASLNGPRYTVVAGPVAAIDALMARLAADNIEAKRLQTSVAFHSPATDWALPDLRLAAEATHPKAASVQVISNLTGSVGDIDDGFASPDYWCRQAREPVQFGAGIATLAKSGYHVFVEIGPTPVLLPMARATATGGGAETMLLPSLQLGQSDWRRMLRTLGTLWACGVACELGALDRRRVVTLPTYPFQRRRFWTEPPASQQSMGRHRAEPAEEESAPPPVASVRDTLVAAAEPERRELLSAYVRRELSAALGVALADVDMDRPLNDLGIDSLMLVSLDASIRHDLDVDLPVQELARGNATAIADTLFGLLFLENASRSLTEVVDLAADAVLDDTIGRGGDSVPVADATTVLLTGATGFLGAFLLAELLRRTRAHVVCLVRANDAATGVRRVADNLRQYGLWQDSMTMRISAQPGDLGEPRLGLTEAAFAELGERIDAIYNNGAHVSYVATYDALKASHVGGTREVLRLASIGRPKAVHHISSIAAYESVAYRGDTMAESMPPVESRGIHLAYSRCKWVSEALLRGARDRGVPVTIYRPSLVSGASDTGAWNTNDFLSRMIKGVVEMGCMPAGLDLRLDFSPVDYVSKSVVQLSRQPSSLGHAFHLHHPSGVDWQEFGSMIAALGYPIEFVSYAEWLERLPTRRDGVLYPLLPFFRQRWAPDRLTYIELNQRGYRPRLTCDETTPLLAAAGIVCPPIDETLIARYVGHLAKVGFLRPPLQTVSP